MIYTYCTCRCSSVTVHGTDYKPGCWLCIGVKQFEACSLPEFGLLCKILLVEQALQQPQVIFLVEKANTCGFCQKVFGYIIAEDKTNIAYIPIGSLIFYHPFNAIETCVGLVIKSKCDLHAFCDML